MFDWFIDLIVLTWLASAVIRTKRVQKLLGRSDIFFAGDLYMRRWRIGARKWPGLRLHHIVRSDRDRELHDHPFWFVSFILWGSYTEHLADGSVTTYRAPAVLYRTATTLHRLELTKPAWTFVIRGPIKRVWGFQTETGWIPWTQWVDKVDGNHNHVKTPDQMFSAESSI